MIDFDPSVEDVLIRETTSMERIQIVKDSLGGEYDEFYDDYVNSSSPFTSATHISKRKEDSCPGRQGSAQDLIR